MATIKQVADRAGVSTATVSRVLSASGTVQAETSDRVMSAVRELGYAPNSAARSLRTLRSGKILVTVPDISNPFFGRVIRGVEEAAQEAGYAVLLGDTRREEAREEQYASMLQRKEADGLIFLGHRLPTTLRQLVRDLEGRAPVVNGCEFAHDNEVSSAHIDNARAAESAMHHLYGLGHRSVAVITGTLSSPLNQDRLEGVRACARDNDLEHLLQVAVGDFSVDSGEEEAFRLLSGTDAPTAIFCFSDEMAMGTLTAARQLGLQCPSDVSVVGFDDIRYARLVDPPLTTIRQPMTEIGRKTVKLLVGLIDGTTSRPRSITLPHELVVRDSTAPPRR